jgi:two-component system cell cycle response regulator DivK
MQRDYAHTHLEDQDYNRTIMRDLLNTAVDRLIEAVGGEEGVKLAQSERPDLILMGV